MGPTLPYLALIPLHRPSRASPYGNSPGYLLTMGTRICDGYCRE